MITVKKFVFNSFQENTYLLYDETKEGIIVDPGCYEDFEKRQFDEFISDNNIKLVRLINTHSHVDHILGNNHIIEKYNIGLEIHKSGLIIHQHVKDHGAAFGLIIDTPNEPINFLEEGDKIKFGNSEPDVIYTPGHVDGHICLVSHDDKFIIAGDVLFQMSIGRTDLPTGDFDLLINNIKEKILKLPDDFTVYPGHGPETTIGFEKKHNPYLEM